MDVEDIDSIAFKFRTMNTNDKDHLITEFRRLANTDLANEACCFYLDLAEWNLNTALWAYYEYAAASNNLLTSGNPDSVPNNSQITSEQSLPQMKFLCDITIGEGESVAPGTSFVKTWRVMNTGPNKWPYGVQLKYVNGYNFKLAAENNEEYPSSLLFNTRATHLSQHAIRLAQLEPEESCEVSVHLKSPDECQMYQCQLKLFTEYGQPFGDPIWLLLSVEEGGVLGITQQLNSVSMFNGAHKKLGQNPFGAAGGKLVAKSETLAGGLDDEKRPDFYDDMFS